MADGNVLYSLENAGSDASSIIDYTEIALCETGFIDLVDQMKQEAMSGDHANLVAVCNRYIDMANIEIGG